MLHSILWRVGAPTTRWTSGPTAWRRRASTRELDGHRCASPTPRASSTSWLAVDSRDPPLVAPRRRHPGRARDPGLPRRRAPTRATRSAAPPLLRDARLRAERATATGRPPASERGGALHLRRAAGRARHPGRRHRPPHRLDRADDDARARWRDAAARRRARTSDADHRPPVLPLGLLPRAVRRAVRARHAATSASTPTRPRDTLGEALKLPPQHEHLREQLEHTLTPLGTRAVTAA